MASSDTARAGRRAWAGLLQVHAAVVPVLDRELQRATGLPLAWYDVLLELDAAPDGRLRMGDLGARVVLSRTRVSRLVEEMVRAGLVRREANPDDRRSAFAVITDHGRERRRAAAPTYLAGIAEHFTRHVDADRLQVLGDALWQVHDRAGDARGPQ
jgi:DNA-binding MarR family transcriptional regulator